MKKSLLLFLLLAFTVSSCNVNGNTSVKFDDVEIINQFGETIYIAFIAELGLSNRIDPLPKIDLNENNSLVKLEPNKSHSFYTDKILEYYPGADFRIYIYGFDVTEKKEPSKLVQLTSIFTVKHADLVMNNGRIPITK